MSEHIPVLVKEVVTALRPSKGGVFLDATLGLAGHTLAMQREVDGTLTTYGIDQDEQALAIAGERLGATFPSNPGTLIKGNFMDLTSLAEEYGIPKADAILMDVGVSSLQLDEPERGFSFTQDGLLDMRMDADNSVSAFTIVNTWSEHKLAMLLRNYGEERLAAKIAKAIVHRRRKRQIETTKELADLIVEQYHPALRHKKPHPATRSFQAIRIEVNQELEALEQGICAALELLAPAGRLAVISFHSLEDRIVKELFRQATETGSFVLVTKKPLTASEQEQVENSRSRSAKLRVIERVQ